MFLSLSLRCLLLSSSSPHWLLLCVLFFWQKRLYSLSKLCVCLFVILHLACPLFILHWVHYMVHPLVCPTLLCPHISSTTHWFLFCILFPCHIFFVFFIKIVCLFVCHPHIVSSCDLSSHCLILWLIVKQQFIISFIPTLIQILCIIFLSCFCVVCWNCVFIYFFALHLVHLLAHPHIISSLGSSLGKFKVKTWIKIKLNLPNVGLSPQH